MVKALFFQAVVVIGWGLVTGLQMNYFGIHKTRLLFWNQLQKNEYAAYLGFVLVFSLAAISVWKGGRSFPWRKIALGLVVIVPVAWMFTFSRSGFVGIILSLFVFLILDGRKKILSLILRWGPIIIFVVLLLFLVFSSEARDLALDGLISIVNPEQAKFERHVTNIEKRIDLLSVGLEIVRKYPLTGIDISQWLAYSPLASGHFDPQLGKRVIVGLGVHNRFLSIAVQSGLITLAGYVGFLAVVLIRGYRLRPFAGDRYYPFLNALLASLAGFQAAMLFIPEYLWEWTILGLLLALMNLIERESVHIPPERRVFRIFHITSSRPGSKI
jgi:hypothetical protein